MTYNITHYLLGLFVYTVNFLDGIVDTAVVELGELGIASFLAERRYTGQPFFRNGKLVAICLFSNNFLCIFHAKSDLSK